MMKLLNKKQKSNGGFSLVELIVVIAIMVVLVAVLAPIFVRYIESSRRSTDVQNANAIAEGVLADAADNKITASVSGAAVVAGTPSAMGTTPQVKGDAVDKEKNKGGFIFDYDKDKNVASVYVAADSGRAYNLATEKGAQDYKDKKD